MYGFSTFFCLTCVGSSRPNSLVPPWPSASKPLLVTSFLVSPSHTIPTLTNTIKDKTVGSCKVQGKVVAYFVTHQCNNTKWHPTHFTTLAQPDSQCFCIPPFPICATQWNILWNDSSPLPRKIVLYFDIGTLLTAFSALLYLSFRQRSMISCIFWQEMQLIQANFLLATLLKCRKYTTLRKFSFDALTSDLKWRGIPLYLKQHTMRCSKPMAGPTALLPQPRWAALIER